MKAGRLLACFFAACLFMVVSLAKAQVSSGDIVGTVTDSTGSVIPNAAVTIKNLGTGAVRSVTTNETGDYSATLLQVGTYSITIQVSGFKSFTHPRLVLAAGDRARVDASLQVGEANQTVTVQGSDAPVLQTDTATTGELVTQHAVQDLPLNGRNFAQLVQLVPGGNQGPPNSETSGTRPDDRRLTTTVSVNGQSDVLNNNLIDGIDNNERISGLFGVRPSVDAIQEVRVDTNLYSADVGRTAGAIVNIITKAGTNQFSGSLYEFIRNDIFDAKNYFNVPQAGNPLAGVKPEYRQNQFGGSLGGPIRKNKTFFFTDVEALRIVQGLTSSSTVPSACELGAVACNGVQQLGNFSDLLPSIVIYDPTTGMPFQNNVIPTNRLNSISQHYAALLPTVSSCSNPTNCQFVYNPTLTQNAMTFDVRIDQHFSANDYLYARYSLDDTDTFIPGALPELGGIQPGGNPAAQSFPGPASERQQQAVVSYLHIFNPAVALQLNASFLRSANQALPLNYGNDVNTSFGGPPVNVSQFTSGLAPVTISGYQTLGDSTYLPLGQFDNTFGYTGQLSMTKGAHEIKIGAGFYRRQLTKSQSTSPKGSFSFDTNLTNSHEGGPGSTGGNAFASFLLGYPTNQQRALTLVVPGYRTWEPNVYVQDNWRAQHWLTLNVGLRYDLYTPYTEIHNEIANFDPEVPSVLAGGKVLVAGNGIGDTAGIKTDYSNLSPRFGFAATVTPKTVLRGGFGMSFFPTNYQSPASLKNQPFTSTFNLNTPLGQAPGFSPPVFGANLPAPIATSACLTVKCGFVPSPGAGTTTNVPAAESFKFRSSYVYQFNVIAERQIGANSISVGYVGVIGRHLYQQIPNLNLPLPPLDPGGCGVTTVINLPNPCQPYYAELPITTTIQYIQTEGVSSYGSLQATFERRFNRGLAFSSNYTYASSLSNVGDIGQACTGCGIVLNRLSTYDYGNSDLLIRHRWTMTLNYQLPFGNHLHGFSGVAAKGWQINFVAVASTGPPYTVISDVPQINNGVSADRPNRVAGTGGFGALSHRTLHEYFDITAFQKQSFGTAGDEGRNPLFSPGLQHVDFSVLKDFELHEPLHLQFRFESFNLFNSPAFAPPGNTITTFNSSGEPTNAGSFGVITATNGSYTPRELQFALKLLF